MEVMGELNQAGFNSISLITLAAGETGSRDREKPAP
jgi:biopolymer transport protein TolR